MIKQEIENLIEKAVGKKAVVVIPDNLTYGDFSTNVAIKEKLNAQEIAEKLQSNKLFKKVEAVNGFINFYLSESYWQNQVAVILKQKDSYGKSKLGKGAKAQVEFISANPTGPLTLGNGRGGFCGDVLANVLSWSGYNVEREYYVNDRGVQIRALGHSVIGDEQAVYKGDYIDDLRKALWKEPSSFRERNSVPLIEGVEKVGKKAAKEILNKMIKPTVKRMGIKFDNWFSEASLYKKNEVEKTLNWLKKQGLTYKNEGALWFKSTKFGDDKDRVLVKADGETTYLASDIAYLKNKKSRGFKKIFYFWGADHYGYVGRMQAAAKVLSFGENDINFIVMQLVQLFKDGKEARMSKREGVYVTLDELIEEIVNENSLGLDSIRYFFLSRGANSHLNFDLSLAKEQNDKNPVYYIQYAHARISSILRKAEKNYQLPITNYQLLNHPAELKLIKQLARLPEIIEETAKDFQVQRLAQYTKDVAADFHHFYSECLVIDKGNQELTKARLALVGATKIVLKNTLSIMAITAPEKM